MSNTSSSEFRLDSDTAGKLLDACDVWKSELRAIIYSAGFLGTLDGFGTLGSGEALKTKFEKKAVGGPDSLVKSLESHVTVVEDMRAYFQKCIDDAVAQEEANTDSLRNAGPPT